MTLRSRRNESHIICWGSSNSSFIFYHSYSNSTYIFFFTSKGALWCVVVLFLSSLCRWVFLGPPRRFARCAVWILRWKRLRFYDDAPNPILSTLLFDCGYDYYSNIRQMIFPTPDSTLRSSSIGRRIHIQAPCATRNLGTACRMHIMHHVSSLCCGSWNTHIFGGISTCGANWRNCVDMDGLSL